VFGMVYLSSSSVRVFYNEVKFGCEGIVGINKKYILFFFCFCVWWGGSLFRGVFVI